MEKITFLRTAKNANAVFCKINEFEKAIKTPGNKPRIMKIKPTGDTDKTIIVWAIKTGENEFGGADIEGEIYKFERRQIVPWMPYNGQPIGKNQTLFFDLSGEPYIEVLLIPDGRTAEKIICSEYSIVQGHLIMVSSYQFPEETQNYKKLQYYWAMRLSMHHYAALNPFTGAILTLLNFGDDLKETFRAGDNIGEYYKLTENEESELFLMHR